MSDRSEAPTPRRLEEAREEGQVARSVELNTAAIILVSALLLRGPGGNLATAIEQLLTGFLIELPKIEITSAWLKDTYINTGMQILPPLGIFLLGLLAVGVAVTVAQTRLMWSSKKIGFDFKRLNPLSGLKRIFSAQGLMELARALLKLGLTGWVAYNFIRANYTTLLELGQYDLPLAVRTFADVIISLTLRVGGAYLVLAAADYFYQRWTLMRHLRMTREEIKEEIRRSEGDPFLKSRIRSQQRRMARNRMMANVPKATVVVTNPTHLAIAIEYSPGMSAPKVLAKGAMRVAQRIVAIARENGIPVVQNIPLARAIYKTIDIDQEISPDLYLAMAEVLAYVYRLRDKGLSGQPA